MNAITPVTGSWPLHARFDGPIVMIGFGSIGKGTPPLIERHIAFDRSKFVVIAPDDRDRRLLDERQIRFMHQAVTRENYRDLLAPLLTTGPGRGMVVNLSVDTSSVDLIELAKDLDAFYIDTVVEPWPGLYTDRNRTISERSCWRRPGWSRSRDAVRRRARREPYARVRRCRRTISTDTDTRLATTIASIRPATPRPWCSPSHHASGGMITT